MNLATKWVIAAKVASCDASFDDVRIAGCEKENIMTVLKSETVGVVVPEYRQDGKGNRTLLLSFNDLNDAFWFRIRYDQAVIKLTH